MLETFDDDFAFRYYLINNIAQIFWDIILKWTAMKIVNNGNNSQFFAVEMLKVKHDTIIVFRVIVPSKKASFQILSLSSIFDYLPFLYSRNHVRIRFIPTAMINYITRNDYFLNVMIVPDASHVFYYLCHVFYYLCHVFCYLCHVFYYLCHVFYYLKLIGLL